MPAQENVLLIKRQREQETSRHRIQYKKTKKRFLMFKNNLCRRVIQLRTLTSPTRGKQAKLKNFPQVPSSKSKGNKNGKLLFVGGLALITSLTSVVYQRDPPSEFIESTQYE